MAGTIFGLPLSQQFNANGEPLSGCKLYLYEAGTSTPVDAFEDFGLTVGLELSHPIVADSAGRIPEFWLADGSYRVRLTDSAGNEIFDKASVTALGASSGTASGSGVSDTAILNTGDFVWQPVSGAKTGFVRANARTIGSSASGATERANADVESLFSFLWTNFSNTLCPVTGGRGASAAADWSANKVIATLDMRGRSAYGLDDMGNTAASIVAASTAAGLALGQETKAILTANLPSTTLSLASLVGTIDATITNGSAIVKAVTYESDGASPGGSGRISSINVQTTSISIFDDNVYFTGSIPLGGSGTALATLSPGRAGTWYIKI